MVCLLIQLQHFRMAVGEVGLSTYMHQPLTAPTFHFLEFLLGQAHEICK